MLGGIAMLLVAAAVVAAAVMLGNQPVERPPLPARDGPPLSAARSWGYQLQNVSLQAVASGMDLLVIDYSRDGSEAKTFSAAEIERLRTRADGSRRIVLAYLSIGEAESYRYYWRRTWVPGQPEWLGPENPDWRGNFVVRYWMPGWRRILMQPQATRVDRIIEIWQPSRRGYLDRIIEAGFDGVYLDRVDAFDHWRGENANAQRAMIDLVIGLAAYARQRRPGFLVMVQNGEELLRSADYRRAIDAIAKEDLLYGVSANGVANTSGQINASIADLDRLKADGRPVFVVEYLDDPAKRAEAQRRLAARGYIPQFANRDLRHIPE